MDKYAENYVKLIREARENEDELEHLINQIYEDGFSDAVLQIESEEEEKDEKHK